MTKPTIAVIGMGYVGLPVAMAFSKVFKTYGYDIDTNRIRSLQNSEDCNKEYSHEQLKASPILYTTLLEDISSANFYIITVPTPIDSSMKPDLSFLKNVSEDIGSILKRNDIVVYESTVYPGVTEDICIPILEKKSGLKVASDFKVGYSPERINPGDKNRDFCQISKIVSGIDKPALETISHTYASVITAKLHEAKSIKIAEAAKVIENTQRDLNIALINELAIIFERMHLSTHDVLEAAGSKWNFHPYKPGLVGGHCISVDPYYLTYKAEQIGYFPEVILAGRRVNNNIGKYIAQKTIKQLIKSGKNVRDAIITIFGFSFKENCADFRNTRVIDVVCELEEYGCNVQISDDLVDHDKVHEEYGICLTRKQDLKKSEAIIFAVAHDSYRHWDLDDLSKTFNGKPVIIDVKGTKRSDEIPDSWVYWCL